METIQRLHKKLEEKEVAFEAVNAEWEADIKAAKKDVNDAFRASINAIGDYVFERKYGNNGNDFPIIEHGMREAKMHVNQIKGCRLIVAGSAYALSFNLINEREMIRFHKEVLHDILESKRLLNHQIYEDQIKATEALEADCLDNIIKQQGNG